MDYIVYKLFKIAQYSSGNLRLYDWGWSFFSSKNMQRLLTSWGSYRKLCTVSLSELRLPSLTYEQSSWSAYEHYRTLMANPARTNWGDAWGMVWSELTSLYYEHVKSTNICIHAFSRTWQTANFEISERDRQVESGGSKDAKTIAGSFYPALLHQNTQLNTPFSQKINCMNKLYAVKADGIEKYLLQNKYFIILPTCHKNTSIWCC